MTALLEKLLDRLKSSRVWFAFGGLGLSITTFENEWAKAVVVLGLGLFYIASETYLKKYPPKKA